MTLRYDLVLRGGLVLDPASGLRATADVAIDAGVVQAIGEGLAPRARRVLDCDGQFVTPGLIDSHSHIFEQVSKVGAPPDEAHLRRGVVAVADAGTAGASTFAAFKRWVVEASRIRVLSFLNVSVLGLIDFRFGELVNPATLAAADLVELARAEPGIVRGAKIRLSTDVVGHEPAEILTLLGAALDASGEAGLPLMVHIGETAVSLEDILARLRPGDVVAHCYTGKTEGILDEENKVRDCVRGARERGVIFECAHGKSNFSYAVAEAAIGQGFLPDLVCSDTSYRNWNGPVFDLLTTMSKLVSLGMSLDDVIERATIAPARFLGLESEGYGHLAIGSPANLSVFSWAPRREELPDAAGASRTMDRLEPLVTVVGGDLVEPVPWRGEVASAS